jgi:hypothetical protein
MDFELKLKFLVISYLKKNLKALKCYICWYLIQVFKLFSKSRCFHA